MSQVSKLYDEFQAAVAAYKALPEGDRFDRAVADAGKIATAIVAAPAATVDEMLLKIKVVDEFADGEEHDALLSLRRDLKRLKVKAAA